MTHARGTQSGPHVFGRYVLHGAIASGGMATVHYGRLLGPVGFSRTVAIKRLHAQLALDPDFVSMFVDEARLATRIRHPNVVPTLDIVSEAGELLLVMDYVPGESLAQCLRAVSTARQTIPIEIVSAIGCAILHGLDAAHEATGESGEPLHIVHRDVSPQNVLVGADGVPRLIDFGVAKAAGRIQTTREGQLKGKIAYMAPEQLNSAATVDRRTDVYAAGVVLWETLTRQRLFFADNDAIVMRNVLEREVEPPSAVASGLDPRLDGIVMRALQREPARRFQTAREMALALEAAVAPASATRVAAWLGELAGDRLAKRAATVAQMERESSGRTSIPGDGEVPASESEAETVIDPTRTQVSGVSVARQQEATQPSPLVRRAILTGAATAGIGVAVVLGLVVRWGGPAAPPATSASVPPAPSVLPVATDVAPPADSATAASSIAPPASAIPVFSIVAPPPPAPARPGRPCPVRSYVDSSGIKHYVRDCK
jgi:serine/threonine-protein kinase